MDARPRHDHGAGLDFAPGRSPPRPALTSRVLWPQDPAYASARWVFNARFSRFPAAIVVCNNPTDVQHAIRWARHQGLPLCARSGGHSYEAWSVRDNALVIDVGGLSDIAIDPARGHAVVGTGVRLGDLAQRLGAAGFAVPLGSCPGVGLAGLALGGGLGFLARQHGLTCDQLLAVEFVDASGNLVHASDQDHADLFWAIRGGGGGNFGIATAFTFRLQPIANVALVVVTWPWDDAAAVFAAWQQWAPVVDPRLVAALNLPHPSAGAISATGLFTGPARALPPMLDPLLQVGTPNPPQLWSASWLDAVAFLAGPDVAHSTFKNTSLVVSDPLPASAIATLVDKLRVAPSPWNSVGCFPFSGAIAAVDPSATAFVHRQARFDLQYQAYWQDPSEEAANVAWVRATRAALAPFASGAYVNYIDADITDWATAYYGANLPRLRQIKTQYDPDRVFDGPQSIS